MWISGRNFLFPVSESPSLFISHLSWPNSFCNLHQIRPSFLISLAPHVIRYWVSLYCNHTYIAWPCSGIEKLLNQLPNIYAHQRLRPFVKFRKWVVALSLTQLSLTFHGLFEASSLAGIARRVSFLSSSRDVNDAYCGKSTKTSSTPSNT